MEREFWDSDSEGFRKARCRDVLQAIVQIGYEGFIDNEIAGSGGCVEEEDGRAVRYEVGKVGEVSLCGSSETAD